MDDREAKITQYKCYLDSIDNFVDRNFHVNRFFIMLNIGLLIGLIVFNKFAFADYITAGLLLSSLGTVTSLLYLGNVDAYSFLIKLKLKDVIEPIEKELPLQIHESENHAIEAWRKNSKTFVFTDLQKVLAYLFLLIFAINFLHEIVPFVIYTFNLF